MLFDFLFNCKDCNTGHLLGEYKMATKIINKTFVKVNFYIDGCAKPMYIVLNNNYNVEDYKKYCIFDSNMH